MKNLVLKNKAAIITLEICMILGSTIPIIWYINLRLPYFNNYEYNYWIPFTSIFTILFITALLTRIKLIFNLSFIMLSIVNMPGCFGYQDINTFVLLIPEGAGLYFDIETIIPLAILIVLLILSIYIVIRHSKTQYKNIRLKHLIPYIITSCIFIASIFYYNEIDLFYMIQAFTPYFLFCIYFLFYPKEFIKYNNRIETPEMQLSNLNNMYITGQITLQQYDIERQKIIENI